MADYFEDGYIKCGEYNQMRDC